MARRFRWSDAADEFGAMTILLHWLVAVLVLPLVALGLLMPDMEWNAILERLHGIGAWLVMALLALHVLGALRHVVIGGTGAMRMLRPALRARIKEPEAGGADQEKRSRGTAPSAAEMQEVGFVGKGVNAQCPGLLRPLVH